MLSRGFVGAVIQFFARLSVIGFPAREHFIRTSGELRVFSKVFNIARHTLAYHKDFGDPLIDGVTVSCALARGVHFRDKPISVGFPVSCGE